MIFSRLKKLCAERGVSVTKLESELGFSTSTIQKWRTSSTPNANNIIKVARYFGVSTDYLLGETDVETTLDEFIHDNDIVSLQRARSKMSKKDRKRMMDMLRIGFEYAFRNADDSESDSDKADAE